MALIINGKPYEVPGLVTRSWLDNPKWRLDANEDRKPRNAPRKVTAIVLHTTDGSSKPQPIKPGKGPAVDPATKTFKYWSEKDSHSGAHLWIGQDGVVYCAADLYSEQTPHAGNHSVNSRSIGIEMYTAGKNTLYQYQVDAMVKLLDFLTSFNWPGTGPIQRQYHWPYADGPSNRIGPGGAYDKKDFFGIFGHRDAVSNDSRGRGDPGDYVFQALGKAGYEPFNTNTNEDKKAWAQRQARLNVTASGVPGIETSTALKRAGHSLGLWVRRPSDGVLGPGLILIGALILAIYLWKTQKS